MVKILVTGASGLLGTEICRQLKLNPDNEVWALDNHSRSSSIPPCDEFRQTDLNDPNSLGLLPRDFDQIYHYSAINGTTNFYERPTEVLTNNFICDVNVFRFAEECPNLTKLVYASTSEIVSDDPTCPVPELVDINIQDIHNPRWSYRLAKICSENYVVNSKLPWVTIRYFNIYGPSSKIGHFIGDQIKKIKEGKFEVIGADETRSFCYIEDAIEATVYCANNVLKQVVNVGNDQETLIEDAVTIIADVMGHGDAQWNFLPGRAGSTKRRLPNIDKLRSLMPDYSPRTFYQGMTEIVKHIN